MAWFGRKPKESTNDQVLATKPEDLGVVIHVMPKDFYGSEALLRVEPKPVPVPPPVPAAPPSGPKPIIAPLPPRRRMPVVVWVFIGVLLLSAGGGIAYVFFAKSQKQPTPIVATVPVTLPQTTPATQTPVVSDTPKEPAPSKDTDSDGLTDIEERMYGTDARNPDSDKDTFLDGNEVFHRYDPNGLAPSTLLDTGAVKVFSDDALPFTLYYPTSWRASVDAAKKIVTFKTPNLATVTVSWGQKDADLTVEDWILKNVEDADLTSLKSSYTTSGYYNLRSKDDLIDYLDGEDVVYVLEYALNDSLDISYTQTFAMMVNSFHIISP
jgi:hypothetical protein